MDGVWNNVVHRNLNNLDNILDSSWITEELSDTHLQIPAEDSKQLLNQINTNNNRNANQNNNQNQSSNANNPNNPNNPSSDLVFDDESLLLPLNVAAVLASGTAHYMNNNTNNHNQAANNYLYPIQHLQNPDLNANPLSSTLYEQQQRLRLLDEKWTELALNTFLEDGIQNKYNKTE